MRSRSKIALVALLLVVALFIVAKRAGGPKLYVGADWVRDANARSELLRPGAPVTIDPALFEGVQKRTDSVPARISYRGARHVPESYPFNVVRVKPAENFNLDEATLKVAAIGVGYYRLGVPATLPSESPIHRGELMFFDHALAPISEQQAHELFPADWERRGFWRHFPVVRFTFERPPNTRLKLLNVKAIDTRTGATVAQSGSGFDSGRFFHATFTLNLWRATPVTIAFDIAHGEGESREFTLADGARFSHAAGEYQFLHAGSNRWDTWDTTTLTNMTTATFTPPAPEDPVVSTVLFRTIPRNSPEPFELDFFDSAGGHLEINGRVRNQDIAGLMLPAQPGDIRKARVRRYKSLTRVIMELPYIPGLPEENQNIDNLLEIRIPRVEFHNQWEVIDFVERNTQMKIQQGPQRMARLATTLAPQLTSTDITVGEVLAFVANEKETGRQIVVDREQNQIRIRGSFFEELRRILR